MAKVLVRKGKKQYFEDLDREITVIKEKSFYLDQTSKPFSTQYGEISAASLKKTGTIKTSRGKELRIFDSSFIDDYMRIKRLPQIIPLKDIGFIIASTGIGGDSVVVEGGTGSGALAIMLARLCKKVYSFDVEQKHIDVALENVKTLGIKNITIKKQSLYDPVRVKNADLFCFDLPSPWDAIGTAENSLKPGGFVISYSPTIMQAADFVNSIANNDNFLHIKTVEMIERPWEIEKRKVRPRSKASIHSGFITLARRI
ncbi:methyltransferase domain-containing protein [Candidatus Woesearchaeota archaeon]|nr:methyltransferase domain-containing protein [Candidatus Woesearchaeota archaeon]